MGLLEGQIILGRGWVFGASGISHSARVIKANTRLLNYSERWAAQSLSSAQRYTFTPTPQRTHDYMANLSRRMCQAWSEVFVYCFKVVAG